MLQNPPKIRIFESPNFEKRFIKNPGLVVSFTWFGHLQNFRPLEIFFPVEVEFQVVVVGGGGRGVK